VARKCSLLQMVSMMVNYFAACDTTRTERDGKV